MKMFEMVKDGRLFHVALKIIPDSEDNLSIRLSFDDGENVRTELLTISFPGKRIKNHAYIDTNRHGWEITKWRIDNNLAEPALGYLADEKGIYPVYRFHASMLRKADPAGYAVYLAGLKKSGKV